ncbi:MAG: sugar phosphate isomerase/epimerase [Bryobacteraceae bacterium]|nr:sugar phosphate isomerase/epimerase [Bryobacteraceae bacterium]MDW8376621.1 sugar phosphate isomerase/epimerase family protein [Bryobacterales bacterium]
MNRREFLGSPLAAVAAGLGVAGPARSPAFWKSICSGVFAAGTPLLEQLQAAAKAGFQGIEVQIGHGLELNASSEDLERLLDASRRLNVAFVSIWPSRAEGGVKLYDDDPQVRAAGVENLRKALTLARRLNCGALLLVPGCLGEGPKFLYGYQQTWDRVSQEIQKLVADAARERVYLTVENAQNKFLLSPLEMRAFVDQFQSPWIQTHFDVANVMELGYPQDWIATLGNRIRRVHFKDYKLATTAEPGRVVDLLEGDVDWKAVMSGLRAAGYQGFVSAEYGWRPSEPGYLLKISRALDRILAMA